MRNGIPLNLFFKHISRLKYPMTGLKLYFNRINSNIPNKVGTNQIWDGKLSRLILSKNRNVIPKAKAQN